MANPMSALDEVRAMTSATIRYNLEPWHDRWLDIAEELHEWQQKVIARYCGHLMDKFHGRVRDGWPTRGETVEEC